MTYYRENIIYRELNINIINKCAISTVQASYPYFNTNHK